MARKHGRMSVVQMCCGSQGCEWWSWYESEGSECMTFITHYPLFLLLHPVSLCSASQEAKKLFCVNSLIRKTLTWRSHPLFFLILVGKYFIDFCSNRRRAEMRGALCGIRLCGRFPGWGELWGGMYVCVCGRGDNKTLPLLNLWMNQLWLWSSSHHNHCHCLLCTCYAAADFAVFLHLLLW